MSYIDILIAFSSSLPLSLSCMLSLSPLSPLHLSIIYLKFNIIAYALLSMHQELHHKYFYNTLICILLSETISCFIIHPVVKYNMSDLQNVLVSHGRFFYTYLLPQGLSQRKIQFHPSNYFNTDF